MVSEMDQMTTPARLLPVQGHMPGFGLFHLFADFFVAFGANILHLFPQQGFKGPAVGIMAGGAGLGLHRVMNHGRRLHPGAEVLMALETELLQILTQKMFMISGMNVMTLHAAPHHRRPMTEFAFYHLFIVTFGAQGHTLATRAKDFFPSTGCASIFR